MSVSCGSAGSCAAAGQYANLSGAQDFVVLERNGRWGKAIEIPGLQALNVGGGGEDVSVSCDRAGACAAAGDYSDRSGHSQGFVAAERNGRWGKAIEIPGLGALNTGGGAFVFSVSCAPAGGCAAAGGYTTSPSSDNSHGFAVLERNGRWGKATEIPGLQALNTGHDAGVQSLSCASPGSCAAGGGLRETCG